MKIPRLHAIAAALAPIDGVCILDAATKSARIDFKASATQAQKDAVASAVAAADWTQAGDDAWGASLIPVEKTDILAAADAAIAANQTYLGLASPSNAQNTAQVKALTQQMNKIIKRMKQL